MTYLKKPLTVEKIKNIFPQEVNNKESKGGSFDIIAGRTRRALKWMQKSGLEWVYRIYQEPRRMWKRYAKTNPVFMWMVLKEYFRLKAKIKSADYPG